MGILQVQNLVAGYGDTEILHGVQLDVAENQITTIIGPNGAGKSTLLKSLMGFLIPRSGRVLFDGRDITHLAAHSRVLEGIAFVPQLDNVFPSLSVEENLKMGGYTLARDQVAERIALQYERFPRLAERRHQRVHTMSGGERQMLALARALMTEPRLLLLDEPTAALSPRIAAEVFEKIQEINARGRTVLIVEQNAELSLRCSAFGIVMADGKNAFDGPADRILTDEKIREAYLGTAKH
ncbi:ABC transporter ATP-binding protein [Castellaniella hirudinis]|uniref:ABC transporter ATP-binding protein n=1 Tax=Castellaniella hirudinis TaxID=1144617 RepID=UPI0039C257FD